LLLLSKAVQNEAKLKDLQMFGAFNDSKFLSTAIYDVKEAKTVERKEPVANLIEGEVTEGFNFKSLMQQQSGPTNPLFEGIDVMQLQTFEQLFFSNYTKLKNSFKKFKGMANDCHTEIGNLEKIHKLVDSMNKFFQPKSLSTKEGGSIQELRLQFQNLKDQSEEVLQLYEDGIDKLKVTELHPKLKVDGKRYLIDIYYKEE
jgi:hypothetical protein